jgi:hypothetical protein
VRADFLALGRARFDADRLARFRGDPPTMVPVVDANPPAPSALPTAESWTWFTETHMLRAPAWRNEVTVRSLEMAGEDEPVAYLPTSARRRCCSCRRTSTPQSHRPRDRRLR